MKNVIILVVLLVCVMVALPVAAGGWAVVTLDALPAGVTAETPFTVGFMVRQHGQHPTEGLRPQITAVHTETGESLTVPAEEDGAVGHYVATITLPGAGQWRWHINAFGFDQPMPAIDVQPAVVLPSPTSASAPLPLPVWVIVSWMAAAGILLYWRRVRSWTVLALGLVTAVIGLIGLIAPTTPLAETAVAQIESGAKPSIERGEALFVAKGCVMCHQNERSIALTSPQIGPNLTHYKGSPEFLRSWLSDPPAMKPDSLMPDLQLSAGEIEALVAFLTVEPAS